MSLEKIDGQLEKAQKHAENAGTLKKKPIQEALKAARLLLADEIADHRAVGQGPGPFRKPEPEGTDTIRKVAGYLPPASGKGGRKGKKGQWSDLLRAAHQAASEAKSCLRSARQNLPYDEDLEEKIKRNAEEAKRSALDAERARAESKGDELKKSKREAERYAKEAAKALQKALKEAQKNR